MFKPNNQPELFTFSNQLLSEELQHQLNQTPEKAFHELIFQKINEEDYKVLFSQKKSRPNAPVNVLVAAQILKHYKAWSYDELMASIQFDLRTKLALGLTGLDDQPFSRATLFNFQRRLLLHEQQTGVNLLEKTFDRLTAEQLEQLGIKTHIQRCDSTLLYSNIRHYSRLQLLIEMLLRVSRLFDKQDKDVLSPLIKSYQSLGSEKYIYQLKASDVPHELQQLAAVYHQVYQQVCSKLAERDAFKFFQRAYQEHFTLVDGVLEPKPADQLHSGMLQSPDDWEATYRIKQDQEGDGFAAHVAETAVPENPIQLLADAAVDKNNVDDSRILEKRIDPMTEKTPDLDELHTDAGYSSQAVDQKMEEHQIVQVPTAIRGRQSKVEITITQQEQKDQYTVSCPEQQIKSQPTPKRNKAEFDTTKCQDCPLKEVCSIFKNKGRYYFKHTDLLKNKRNNNIHKIPIERQKIRPNVEATIREFKAKTQAGKLRTRGLFKAKLFVFSMAIGINFGRIYRYLREKQPENHIFLANFNIERTMNHYSRKRLRKAELKDRTNNQTTELKNRVYKTMTYFLNWTH